MTRQSYPTANWLSLWAILLLSSGLLCGNPLPSVKEWQPKPGTLSLQKVICYCSDGMDREIANLHDILHQAQIEVVNAAENTEIITISLECKELDLPVPDGDYRDNVLNQGYELEITEKNIRISARRPAGVFYGIQTLRQFIENDREKLPCGLIRDWPDLSVRMIMLDLARQMEHPDYIRRVIDFCARYKINALHLHLTDDQFSCLYHEDYPWLMHPHALQSHQVKELVDYAGNFHIEVIPEIESLGHCRSFIRHPQAGDILHQTKAKSLHAIPGYSNVLCPASPLTDVYLDAMYKRCAELFPSPSLHIGCDEVHLAGCTRCETQWPGLSPEKQFMQHLQHCIALAAKHGKKAVIWNDMFWRSWRGNKLNFDIASIVEDIPPSSVVIYDWHYYKIPTEITTQFKSMGYDVIGCPALMASGYMIYPSPERLKNVQEFARVARENNLMGLNTTIWLPQRYLTDSMWPGIAYSAAQSWAGSNTKNAEFFTAYLSDYHRSDRGNIYNSIWKDLGDVGWTRSNIVAACWHDEASLKNAAKLAQKYRAAYEDYLKTMNDIRRRIADMTPAISDHKTEWQAFDHALGVYAWTIEQTLAAPQIAQKKPGYQETLQKLNQGCLQAITWVTEDWDRNRFADDIMGKDDVGSVGGQHLLRSLVLVNRFHQQYK